MAFGGEERPADRLAAIGFANFNLSGSGEPEQFTSNRISPALLGVLGVSPVAGRDPLVALRDE